MRIGTNLAITVGIGVVLVICMMINQQLANSLVAKQAELERDEQLVTADLLRASIALQRMQTGTRELRVVRQSHAAGKARSRAEAGISRRCGRAQGVQNTTNDAVGAIKEISGTIGHMSEIAATITAAVSGQGTATQDISHNVAMAAEGASRWRPTSPT